MRPWSAVWVDFDPQVGREQAGRRPAIVVGSRLAMQVGARTGLVMVVPCTTTDRGFAWQPRINLDGRPGVAMCDQLKSISRKRVAGPHSGALTDQEVAAIREALRQFLAL